MSSMAFFNNQGQITPKVTILIRPEFELVRDLIPVLVTCKFDNDPIINERASVDTSFSDYSLGEIFPVLKGAEVNEAIGWNLKPSEILCLS